MIKKIMKRIKEFFGENWLIIISLGIVFIITFCIISCVVNPSTLTLLALLGWITALIFSAALWKERLFSDIKVLKAKIEVAESYNEALEQTKNSIEFFTGYNEHMLENVAIYSQMASRGVDAPIANSIITFSQELGLENTVLLINIDHLHKEWSVRVAGKPIYMSQLKAIWTLVNNRLKEMAKPHSGMVISEPTIDN